MRLWLSMLILFSACSTVEKASKNKSLEIILKAYEHQMRWDNLSELNRFLEPEIRMKQPPLALDPNNVRITRYELISPPVITNQDPFTAEQTIRIDYLFKDRQVIHSLTDHQRWQYDTKLKQWWRINLIPTFESL